MKKIILLHGKNTTPDQKWYPWLGKQAQAKGYNFIAPRLPEADNPEIGAWVDCLAELMPDEDTVLVGHSRGGVAVLRFLENAQQDLKIKKVILVATNYAKTNDQHSTRDTKGFYTDNGYNFIKIKQHCEDFVVLHSEDDQWVPFEDGEIIADHLGAKNYFLRIVVILAHS